MSNITWKDHKKAESGCKGFYRDIKVFAIFTDAHRDPEEAQWKLWHTLVGEPKLDNFDSIEEAKKAAEKLFPEWLKKLGIA